MLVIILFSVVAILVIVQYLYYQRSIAYSKSIPNVLPTYPLVGNIPMCWGKSSEQAFWLLYKGFSKVKRLGKVMIGRVVILVNHPDLTLQILTKDCLYDKPFYLDFGGFPNAIIADRNGERWLQRRKILNPTFNTPILTGFMPIMDEQVKEMINNLDVKADCETELDLFQYVGDCALKVVLSTTMGQQVMKLPGLEDLMMHIDRMTNLLGARVVSSNQYLDVFYRMTRASKSYNESRIFCDHFTSKMIRDRRQEILQEERSATLYTDEFQKKSLNFLDQLLTIQKNDETNFSDQVILENVISLIMAGTDTSAITVSNTCLLLAMHPDIQAKVVAEMNQVFYSDDVEITLSTLKQLQYTEQVIKEVLRLYSAGLLIGRQTTNNNLVLDGIQIPKDQIIAINVYTLHRHPDFWGPDPDRFDPERFNPAIFEKQHASAYHPFGTGLRNCIGARYSMNLMRIMLLRILQTYEIKTNLKQNDLRFKYEVALRLVGPHLVWLTRRNKSM